MPFITPHESGIIHRDLKPANVVISGDSTPKISDFGLAKLLESGADATLSGVVLGTPSYMAPEQVHGSPGGVTPAIDVYALGAILYEMLSGHPPFKGSSPLSTLEQVTTQEPLPPGRFQRHLPKDLETICLKCLKKDPRRRYASARELAEDLRRFLDGKPILARPASSLETLWKWARRRPSAATALGSAVMAILLMIGGGAYYNARLRAAAKEADDHARTALHQRNLALKAINELIFNVQEELDETPATGSLRRMLLDTAIAELDEIARGTESTKPDLSRAVAHQKLGAIFRQFGQMDEARKQFHQARDLAKTLRAEPPDRMAVWECLAGAYLGLGQVCLSAGLRAEARKDLQISAELAEKLALVVPGNERVRRLLLDVYFHLGRAYSFDGRFSEGEVWYQKMHDQAEQWVSQEPDNLHAHDLLSVSLRKLGDTRKLMRDDQAAIRYYTEAITFGREVCASSPGNRRFKRSLALALDDLAEVFTHQRDNVRAHALYREAERLFLEMIQNDPEDLDNQLGLILLASRPGEAGARRRRFHSGGELVPQGV